MFLNKYIGGSVVVENIGDMRLLKIRLLKDSRVIVKRFERYI